MSLFLYRFIFPDLGYQEALKECNIATLHQRCQWLTERLFNEIKDNSLHKLHGLLPPRNLSTLSIYLSIYLSIFPFTLLFLFRFRFRFRFRFLFPFPFLFWIPVSGFSRRPFALSLPQKICYLQLYTAKYYRENSNCAQERLPIGLTNRRANLTQYSLVCV